MARVWAAPFRAPGVRDQLLPAERWGWQALWREFDARFQLALNL